MNLDGMPEAMFQTPVGQPEYGCTIFLVLTVERRILTIMEWTHRAVASAFVRRRVTNLWRDKERSIFVRRKVLYGAQQFSRSRAGLNSKQAEIATAYLGLGASVGDRVTNLRNALQGIGRTEPGTRLVAVSSLYESPHLGLSADDASRYPPHLNCVAKIETSRDPVTLLHWVQTWEDRGGRQRTERWGPRTIDIDILLYNALVLQSDRLTIPHPALTTRAFVVVPLYEIAPDLVLPSGQTLAELFVSPIIRDQPIERIPNDELLL